MAALAFLLTLFGMALSPSAFAGIEGSAHDLSLNGEEICIYCHTPMNASSEPGSLLWNRNNSSKTMSMYSSDTMDMRMEAAPGAVSMLCLSCHDGTMAYNSLINSSGASNSGVMTGPKAVGADGLSNDHPIAIEYDPSRDPKFAPVTDGTVGGLPLYTKNAGLGPKTQVECATCHDPHDPSNGNFLRMSNSRSRLCLTCHQM